MPTEITINGSDELQAVTLDPCPCCPDGGMVSSYLSDTGHERTTVVVCDSCQFQAPIATWQRNRMCPTLNDAEMVVVHDIACGPMDMLNKAKVMSISVVMAAVCQVVSRR